MLTRPLLTTLWPRAGARSSGRWPRIGRAAQPCQGLLEFFTPAFGLFALLALGLDHLFRSVAHEARIGELAVDARNIALRACQLLLQPRFLRRKVDHADQRQRRHLATDDELHRA